MEVYWLHSVPLAVKPCCLELHSAEWGCHESSSELSDEPLCFSVIFLSTLFYLQLNNSKHFDKKHIFLLNMSFYADSCVDALLFVSAYPSISSPMPLEVCILSLLLNVVASLLRQLLRNSYISVNIGLSSGSTTQQAFIRLYLQ